MRRRGIRISLCFMWGVLMMIVVIAGCASSEPSWTDFVGSTVEKNFPVPKEANQTETALNNSKMDYVHYKLTGLKESNEIPEAYQKVIAEWGWKEKKEESTGTTRVYEKGKQIVQLTLHDDSFTVLVPKKEEKTVIQGLESSP
ncbi:hypothetical protein IM700_021080 [Paenibacillus sp. DXFW5]|uniref:Lipoprotein n=2 Tax=Paenibacillus rhizolycopersici TaxID=2780073 RepID=A0ABS2HF49_9BACL|nr:hypothetical protein [Paenibacillus timonensis]MBM6998168.1 hypothetical protein [Paenibacillus rhizolycopersici]MUG88373.1 hypothetical protein [Paenibacillus timonensis]